MTAVIATSPKFQFSGADGLPLINGTLTTYVAGTTTPTTTWQDRAQATANTNPIVLDGNGECLLWLDPLVTYKFVLANAVGVQQWSVDNISGAEPGGLREALAASGGSAMIGFLQAGTGAVARTAQAKMREKLSVTDFGAVGDGVTDDTAALTACIAASSNGDTVDGLGLTCLATELLVNKSITIKNLTIHMKNAAAAVQACFRVTANNVKLIDCGTTIILAEIGSVVEASGVFANAVSGIEILRGTYNGSKGTAYVAGVFHSTIYCLNCVEPKVLDTVSLNSNRENIYFEGCTRPQAYRNQTSETAGSGIATDGGTAAQIHFNYITTSGTSGIAINSPDSKVSFNYVKNPATNGISVGEVVSTGTEVVFNTIEGAGQQSTTNYASILVQQADRVKVNYNIIKAPKNNTGSAFYTTGISFQNLPLSFEAIGNDIDSTYSDGIYVLDANDTCTAIICENKITSPWFSGVNVVGFTRCVIRDNHITNSNQSTSAAGYGVSVAPSSSYIQEFVQVVGNNIIDNTPNQREAIRFNDNFSATTMIRINGNRCKSSVTRPYTSGRTGIYDVSDNDWDGTAKKSTVVLTNGGTSTVVNTAQAVADTIPILSIGNAACFTLNPTLWVSAISHGVSFTISHTPGTAAAETVQWVIP